MEDSAQREVHQNLKEPLESMGHSSETVPAAEKPIPLTDELKQIGVAAWHVIGTPVEEVFTGEAPDARVRGSKARKFLDFIRRRGKPTIWK